MKHRDERIGGHSAAQVAEDEAKVAERMRRSLDLIQDEPQIQTTGQAALLPLEIIVPDPIQPRRIMPDLLRARWCKGDSMPVLLTEWEHEARDLLARTKQVTDWSLWLTDQEEDQRLPDETTPLHPHARHWIALLRLAGRIRADGLVVPIEVYPLSESLYRLQMGERRLLAFHLLTWFKIEGFTSISALIFEQYSVFRQALENGARQNLNAIGITRQIALVLLAMHGFDLAGSDVQAEQSWYAHALNLRIPPGKADVIAAMVGLPNPRMVQLHKSLLTLPGPVWNWADQFNWTEGKIRHLIGQAQEDPEQLVRLAQEEATRELGGKQSVQPEPLTLRVDRQISRVISVMQKAVELSSIEQDALSDQHRQGLVELARSILQRYG